MTMEKEGVLTGRCTVNPPSGNKLEVWTASYALWDYGSGVVITVPARDERDFEFACRYGLLIKWVVSSKVVDDTIVRLQETAVKNNLSFDIEYILGYSENPAQRFVDRIVRQVNKADLDDEPYLNGVFGTLETVRLSWNIQFQNSKDSFLVNSNESNDMNFQTVFNTVTAKLQSQNVSESKT